MFSEYLARQLRGRGNLLKFLGVSKATYYRHLKDPTLITVGELKQMILVGELDEEKVINYLYGREK